MVVFKYRRKNTPRSEKKCFHLQLQILKTPGGENPWHGLKARVSSPLRRRNEHTNPAYNTRTRWRWFFYDVSARLARPFSSEILTSKALGTFRQLCTFSSFYWIDNIGNLAEMSRRKCQLLVSTNILKVQTTFFFFQLLLNRQQRFNPETRAFLRLMLTKTVAGN